MSLPNEFNLFLKWDARHEEKGKHGVEGGKNPSQQRGSLPVPQVPIRLTNIWYGRANEIMDLLPSK